MEKIPITSRIIASVYFNQDDGQLQIRFRNGEERHFIGVPENEVIAMRRASSPGQHYINHIRKRYLRMAKDGCELTAG